MALVERVTDVSPRYGLPMHLPALLAPANIENSENGPVLTFMFQNLSP